MVSGNIFSLLQTLGIFSLLSTPWPNGFREFLDAMTLFTADFDTLSIGCAFGDTSTVFHYVVSFAFFPLMVVVLLLGSIISKALPEKYKWTGPNTINVVGAFLQACFLSICGAGTAAFTLYEHPMGDWGVRRYPDIVTSDGKYSGIAIFGSLMCFMALTFFIVSIFLVVKAPSKAATADATFLQACRFLLIRFRVDVWHWGLHLMVRAMLLSLCPVFGVGDPRFQMLLICVVFSISMLLTARHRPWRAPSLNLVDIAICLVLMMLVLTATAFVGTATGNWVDVYKAFLWLETIAAFCILAVMVGLTALSVVRNGPFGTIHDVMCQQCQKTPNPTALAGAISRMSTEAQIRTEAEIAQALSQMQVADLWAIMNAMTIMKETSILKDDKTAGRRQMSVRVSPAAEPKVESEKPNDVPPPAAEQLEEISDPNQVCTI